MINWRVSKAVNKVLRGKGSSKKFKTARGSALTMSDKKPSLVKGKPGKEPVIENLFKINPATVVSIDPKQILEKAMDADYELVMVIGWNKDREFDMRASHSDMPELNWLLDKAKDTLLDR